MLQPASATNKAAVGCRYSEEPAVDEVAAVKGAEAAPASASASGGQKIPDSKAGQV